MSESKMLRARCKKTDRYYALELKNIGGDWKVVNMVHLPPEAEKTILSEVRQPSYVTNANLIPCGTCGSRRVGGCECAKRRHRCSYGMSYAFDCTYCSELEIDYSRSLSRGPYTEWAGTSNIPSAAKDRFGNPQGSEFDLAQDGSFEGYTIVVLNLCNECDFTEPTKALRKKGFNIVEYKNMPSPKILKGLLRDDKSQLWIVSHRTSFMDDEHVRIIVDYYNAHHGVYIWGDNEPYFADANKLLQAIFRTSMRGNSRGEQVLGIQQIPGGPGIIPNHPITTGIVNFFEGITIAEIVLVQGLEPLMYGSDGLVVAAYSDRNDRRLIADGGFTRLCHRWDSAGTDRYVVNAAAWLANIEYFGYYN